MGGSDRYGGAYGVAVLNDSKYGWDKPEDHVLRLTLLHTPLPRASAYQRSQDMGSHRFTFSVAGHAGDRRTGRVPARAAALNQPLIAFQAVPHSGPLGRSFSLLSLSAANGQQIQIPTGPYNFLCRQARDRCSYPATIS